MQACVSDADLQALYDSEYRYFQLGAVSERLPGAVLYHLPGLLDLPAGCVAFLTRPPADPPRMLDVLAALQARVQALGAPLLRIYDHSGDPLAAGVLQAQGYRASCEVALLTQVRGCTANECLHLHPVTHLSDWQKKLRIHRSDCQAPDGHEVDGRRWVEMERQKSRSGELRLYIASRGKRAVGAVGALQSGSVLRLKNIVVAREFRKQGVGFAMVRSMLDLAFRQGHGTAALFAADQGPALSMYKRAGFVPAGQQIEWVKAC